MLKNIDKQQLSNLKNSLENELKIYNARTDVSMNSKKFVNSLEQKALSNIDKILLERTKTPKAENRENTVNTLFEKVGINLSKKEKEALSTIQIENIDNFHDLIKEKKTELVKKSLKKFF